MNPLAQAIRYIRNTNGNATLEDFKDDHDSIGDILWRDLERLGLATIENGKVVLTEKGKGRDNA